MRKICCNRLHQLRIKQTDIRPIVVLWTNICKFIFYNSVINIVYILRWNNNGMILYLKAVRTEREKKNIWNNIISTKIPMYALTLIKIFNKLYATQVINIIKIIS